MYVYVCAYIDINIYIYVCPYVYICTRIYTYIYIPTIYVLTNVILLNLNENLLMLFCGCGYKNNWLIVTRSKRPNNSVVNSESFKVKVFPDMIT